MFNKFSVAFSMTCMILIVPDETGIKRGLVPRQQMGTQPDKETVDNYGIWNSSLVACTKRPFANFRTQLLDPLPVCISDVSLDPNPGQLFFRVGYQSHGDSHLRSDVGGLDGRVGIAWAGPRGLQAGCGASRNLQVLCWGFLTTPLVDYALRIQTCADVFFFWCISWKWGACLSFLHGSRPCVCTCSVALALLIPITRFCVIAKIPQSKTMFVRQDGPNVVKLPTGVPRHMTHDTVGKRVGGSGRHQFAATRPTCCWSCWESLGSDPHYGIAGTIPPAIVAMFRGSKLARRGVGDGRRLTTMSRPPFFKALRELTSDWNMSRSNVQWVRTSLWAPSEMPPFCWPLVDTSSTLTMMIYMLTGM